MKIAEHFERVMLLEASACEQICGRIEQRRRDWIRHHEEIPIHSFGISGFLVREPADYYRTLQVTNPLLLRTLPELYETVRSFLQDRLGAPVADHPTGALPGFNLFGSHPYFETPFASAHFDVQHRNLEWPRPVEVDDLWSFTLPVVLPRRGGSLDLWDLRQGDLDGLDAAATRELIDDTPRYCVPHSVGTVVFHRGDILHRIAPTEYVSPGDRRYTMQGHVARSGGHYYWYW